MKYSILIFILLVSTSLQSQDFDPVNPNYDLLEQIVIEKLNQKREKKNHKTLIANNPLQTTANYYTALYKSSKLEKNKENKLRVNKKIKKICKANGYKNAFINYHILSVNCVKYFGKKFYYDKEDTETSTHLFEGNRPTKKEKQEENFKQNPIKLYSNNELADIIVKQFLTDEGFFKTLNNGYDKFGFSIVVERRTLFRSKLPKIKAIMIVGGNRITW